MPLLLTGLNQCFAQFSNQSLSVNSLLTKESVVTFYISFAMLLSALTDSTSKRQAIHLVQKVGHLFDASSRWQILAHLYLSSASYNLQSFALMLIKYAVEQDWHHQPEVNMLCVWSDETLTM